MFDELVPEYDRFNRLSSFGLDVLWRKKAASYFKSGFHVLDVGTGTGDLAQQIALQGCRVTGVDFSESMISAARKKSGENPQLNFAVAEANRLPFESMTFGGITSAFVLRNLHRAGILVPSLREFARVIQPEGVMVHLELTRPPKGLLSLGHQAYMKTILPSFGKILFGRRWPKNYLKSSIEEFPTEKTLLQWIRWAGFEQVCHYPLSGGIASLFVAVRC